MAKVSFSRAHYAGGLSGTKPERRASTLVATDEKIGTGFLSPKTGVVEWVNAVSVEIVGGQAAKSKVGAELAFGALGALGAKGSQDRTTVVVRTKDGQRAYYEVFRVSPAHVAGKLSPILSAAGVPLHDEAAPAAAQGASTADELRKLAQLRDEGILSPEEFEAQKAKLLG